MLQAKGRQTRNYRIDNAFDDLVLSAAGVSPAFCGFRSVEEATPWSTTRHGHTA